MFCTRSRSFCAAAYTAAGDDAPRLLQNLGVSFLDEPFPFRDELMALSPKEPTAAELPGGALLFAWNHCPAVPADCATAIVLERNGGAGRVSLIGRPLSRSDRDLSPRWTEEWLEPFLEFHCPKGPVRVQLLPRVGTIEAPEKVTALAPFQRQLKLPCHGGSISAGRKEVRVFRAMDPQPFLVIRPEPLRWNPKPRP